MSLPEETWGKAAAALEAASSVAVCCHVNPDGDALGSMLALGLFLERLGKKVWMSWGSPEVVVPLQYRWLPGVGRTVPPAQVPRDSEVFVAIDCADIARLEELRPAFDGSQTTINIDHHDTNDSFAEINLVDSVRASSCELANELISKMGGTPTREEATCLYTGIVTDTGRFMFPNATPQTLRTAATLREIGIDHAQVAVDVFESASFAYLHVVGVVLSKARLEDGLVWSWVDQNELVGLALEETEDLIDQLRAVREAEVAMLLKQLPEGNYRVSLRSRGNVDVGQVAKSFGGGGHQRAAGFSIEGSAEECAAAVRKRIVELGS